MLEVEQLSVAYAANKPIFQNMNFSIAKGEILNILGQNAVGKTTLIRCLEREIKPIHGKVYIDGKNADEYDIKEYARKVGVVTTTMASYQNLLVADYIMAGVANRNMGQAFNPSKYIEEAYQILCGLGYAHLLNKRVDHLSSGEKQMVMMARVMMQNPEMIIIDEPTANLDVRNQLSIIELIMQLRDQGYALIVTTHNPGHALTLSGKTLLMGKNSYEFGKTEEIICEEMLSRYYELNVKMESVDNHNCIIFCKDKDSKVKIRF